MCVLLVLQDCKVRSCRGAEHCGHKQETYSWGSRAEGLTTATAFRDSNKSSLPVAQQSGKGQALYRKRNAAVLCYRILPCGRCRRTCIAFRMHAGHCPEPNTSRALAPPGGFLSVHAPTHAARGLCSCVRSTGTAQNLLHVNTPACYSRTCRQVRMLT